MFQPVLLLPLPQGRGKPCPQLFVNPPRDILCTYKFVFQVTSGKWLNFLQTVLNISLLKSSWKTKIPRHLDNHIQLGILYRTLKLRLSQLVGSTARQVINVTCLVYWGPGRCCAQSSELFAACSTTGSGRRTCVKDSLFQKKHTHYSRRNTKF